METEEQRHSSALLESIQTHVKVIAEGHVALVARLDHFESRFDQFGTRFDRLETHFNVVAMKVDRLETKVDGLETKVDGLETKVDGLEVFASDAQRRLERIETRLELNGSGGSNAPRKPTRVSPPKPRKKS